MSYTSEALEQQHITLQNLLQIYDNPHLRPGASHKERIQWLTDINCLRRAEPFYWNDRTVELVSSTMNDFKLQDITCTRSLLYNDVAWHWFAGKCPFEVEEYKTKRMLPLRALTWYWFGVSGKPYLGVTGWIQSMHDEQGLPAGPVAPAIWACVDNGQLMSEQIGGDRLNFQGYTDDRTAWETEQLRYFVICASTFLRQELLSTQRVPAERHTRKRILRDGGKVQDVQVIQLRRTQHVRKDDWVGSLAQEREWQFQWTVRGHQRMQYYASLGEHLPVYIHPYIKGPEDKPLKPRTSPIYSVTK